MVSVKFCYDTAVSPFLFRFLPCGYCFAEELAGWPENTPNGCADAVPQGAPELTAPLPPEQVQRKEYTGNSAGHAVILHDKFPNIKDDFFRDGHGGLLLRDVSLLGFFSFRFVPIEIGIQLSPEFAVRVFSFFVYHFCAFFCAEVGCYIIFCYNCV